MAEETSLLDWFSQFTPSDDIWLGALIGGILMWGWWRYKQADLAHGVTIDKTKKEISLGLYLSAFVGFIGGSLIAILAHKQGLDVESSALIAGIGGIVSTWSFHKIANWQYTLAVKVAQHPILAPNPTIKHALTDKSGFSTLSVLDKKIRKITGDPTMPVSGESVKDWEHRRELILHTMVKWYDEGRAPTKEELAQIHSIFPNAPDLEAIRREVEELGSTQTSLQLSEKMKTDQIILTQSSMIEEYSTELKAAQEQLKLRDRRYQPQHRYPRELIYSLAGTAFGYFMRWLTS